MLFPVDPSFLAELQGYTAHDITNKNESATQSKTASLALKLIIVFSLAGGGFLIATSGGGLSLAAGFALVALALITIAVRRIIFQEEDWAQKLVEAMVESTAPDGIIQSVISNVCEKDSLHFAQRARDFIFPKNRETPLSYQEKAVLAGISKHLCFFDSETQIKILEGIPKESAKHAVFSSLMNHKDYEKLLKAVINNPEQLPNTFAAVVGSVGSHLSLDHSLFRQLMAIAGQEKANKIVYSMYRDYIKFLNSTLNSLADQKEEISPIVFKALASFSSGLNIYNMQQRLLALQLIENEHIDQDQAVQMLGSWRKEIFEIFADYVQEIYFNSSRRAAINKKVLFALIINYRGNNPEQLFLFINALGREMADQAVKLLNEDLFRELTEFSHNIPAFKAISERQKEMSLQQLTTLHPPTND